jgi:thiol-disulfide isomerase/thioredoxin
MLRASAILAVAAVMIAALARLDHVLGTGRLLVGLAAGAVLGASGVVGFIVYMNRKAAKSAPVRAPPLQEDPVAAFDWNLVSLDGSTFPMEQLRGEPFLLNIWSTLCPPCLAELPSIERLNDAVRDHGVRVLCVATDDDSERVRKLVTANGWRVPVYVLDRTEIPRVFDSDYIPATYVVGADGRVVMQHTGAARWDHPRIVTFLRSLAARSAVSPFAREKLGRTKPVRSSLVPALTRSTAIDRRRA